MSSVVEVFKVANCRVIMTYRDSQVEQVKHAGIVKISGSKGELTHLAQANSMLKLRDIIVAP